MKTIVLASQTILLFYLIISCRNEPLKPNSKAEVMKVSLNYLVTNYKSLHGQKIETEGVVYFEFENVAICTNKKLFSNESDCFWLNFSKSIELSDSDMQKTSGKIFVLRGFVDTSSKGHLSYYLVILKGIDFLKQK